MKMGTSSAGGIQRGQLRPHLGGRAPPFLIVGLFVVICILGFSYWSLSAQYYDLHVQFEELRERVRITAEKKAASEKELEKLNVKLKDDDSHLSKLKSEFDNRETEFSQVSQQLRVKDEELNKKIEEVDATKNELENCKKTNTAEKENQAQVQEKLDICEKEKKTIEEEKLVQEKNHKEIEEKYKTAQDTLDQIHKTNSPSSNKKAEQVGEFILNENKKKVSTETPKNKDEIQLDLKSDNTLDNEIQVMPDNDKKYDPDVDAAPGQT